VRGRGHQQLRLQGAPVSATRRIVRSPSGPWSEFAGVIDEVGEAAHYSSRVTRGARVAPPKRRRTSQPSPADQIAPKPLHPSRRVAAGGPSVRRQHGRVVDPSGQPPQRGETVLQSAVAGGVGLFAAQFARR
jgi:NADPH:quinone reductase-like Zn-dependent oxidoreductase